MRRLLILLILCSIGHVFVAAISSYAGETDGDVPLAGVGASFQSDLFTGTLTGSIPVEIPPGRNGMQPNLSLVYESAGGNGWVGMGWKLEMGAIERQTKWGVLYSPTTAEEQAGKVYAMRLNGVSIDLVQDATDPLLYHEKVKSGFLRIKKLAADGTAGWEITDTKGTKYKFGTGTTTRIASGSLIYKWCLERVEDRDGNYLMITYQDDGATNQRYLSQIDYAGNGVIAPTNQVKFYLEDRTDKPAMYTSNFPITTAKRLKTIEVKADGSLVRAYEFNYDVSPATSRSILASVKQHGKDAGVDAAGFITPGTTLPSTTFNYSADTQTFTDGTVWATTWCSGGVVSVADLNGDGRQDLWCKVSNTFHATVSNGAGGFSPWTVPTLQIALLVGDFTGDGKGDFSSQGSATQNGPSGVPWCRFFLGVAPSTQSGVSAIQAWVNQLIPYSCGDIVGLNTPRFNAVGDVNGDGKVDFALLNGSANTFSLSTGSAISAGPTFNNWCVGGTIGIADFTGDGRSDLFCKNSGGTISIATSTGSSFSGGGAWISSWCASGSFGVADFNGDGKQDVYCHPTDGTTKIGLSTGTAFIDDGNWVAGFCASGAFGTGDFNGDGKQDLYCHPSDGTTQVALSTGTAFATPTAWFGSWCTTGSYGVGDFTGDGKADLYCFNGGTVLVARSGSSLATPDLVVAVSNGFGGRTAVTYTPSSQWSNTQLPQPVHTVTGLTTCDNWNGVASTCSGNLSTTTYSYTGGFLHIGERDFRGFKTAVVTSPGASDVDKTVTTTWFHQGNELTPIDTENAGLANGYMKGKPYRVEVRRKSDNLLYAKSETTYLADLIGTNTTAPWFTPPAQVDSHHCDGGPCKTTRVTFAAADYDAYGNVKKESHHGDISITGDEKTIERTFITNTTDYLVGFPVRETVYKGLSVAVGDKLAETLLYYDGTGTGTCTTVPTGSNTTVVKGHITKTERWLSGGTNPISGAEYDSATGILLCTRDPLGNRTTLTHDPTKAFVLSSTNQLGHVTTTVYYGVNSEPIPTATGFYGAIKSSTDPNGRVMNYEYDALGRRAKTTAPDGLLITTFTYPTLAEFGNIGAQKVSVTKIGGSLPVALISSTFFDGLGRVFKKEESGPNGTTLVTETQFDVKGQVSQTSLPYFKTTESTTGRWRFMTYDAVGRVTQVTHPNTLGGNPLITKSCYAPFVTVILDPSGARKRETKDAYGRIVKIEEYNSTFSICDTTVGTVYATTSYTYDFLGNLTKVVDTLGNRTTMRYDTVGRKIAMSDPDMSTNGASTCGDLTVLNPAGTYPWYAAPCWTYEYDAAGNLVRQTDAKSQVLWFRYDELNRRRQKDFTTQKTQGAGDVIYTYDDTVTTYNRKGRLKQVADAVTTVTFEYDVMGRINKSTKVLDGTNYITTSVYDGIGRLKEVTYPTAIPKTVEYLYTGPTLEKVQDKAGSGTTIYTAYSNYTSQGQAQTITYGNGVITTSTFADPAHPSCVPANSFKLCTSKTQLGVNPAYQDLTYAFTADGNVDLITDPINGHQSFAYDLQDRLTSAIGPYGVGGVAATLTYTYNAIGNLTNNSQVGVYTYPTSGAGVVRPHAVTAAGGNTYTYDNNGNMTGGAGRTFTWNFENKPLTIVQGGVTTTFVYDGDGGRVKKTVGSTTTRYISKLYECDTTGSGTSCSRFIWAGSTRIATVAENSGTIHYWHGDHLGSSSMITNSTGAKVQVLTYYPYGGIRTNQSFINPAVDVPYKYTGQELDSTGLYYYEARYYDPTLGRFISPDTIVPRPGDPQEFNRYSYAGNNPLIYTDPTGHFSVGKFFKRLFHLGGLNRFVNNNLALRVVGWVFAPYYMSYIDPLTRPYAIAASATIATGYVGGLVSNAFLTPFIVGATGPMMPSAGVLAAGYGIGGAAGGLAGGAIGTVGAVLSGHQVNLSQSILAGMAGGALGGIAGAINNPIFYVGMRGLAGGVSSKISGGDFGTGVAFSAGAASLNAVYRGVTGFSNIHAGGGGGAVDKVAGGPAAHEFANNFGLSGPSEAARAALGSCYEGSSCSNMLNAFLPVGNATAGFHDNVTVWTGMSFIGNYGTMLPSYALTVGGAVDGFKIGPLNVDLSGDIGAQLR